MPAKWPASRPTPASVSVAPCSMKYAASTGRRARSIARRASSRMPCGGSMAAGAATPGPVDRVQIDAFKRSLSDASASLPERDRLVMTLYYDEELYLREIGAVIGVSESRVSQIHSQALIRLQARLGRWLDNDET